MKYINPKHYDAHVDNALVNLERIECIHLYKNTVRFFGLSDSPTIWEFRGDEEASKAYERISIAVA